MIVRAADPRECELLSEVALRSKSYWGYDADFLQACRAELTLAPEDLDCLVVRVAVSDDGRLAGFYALGDLNDDGGEVWFFFVDLPFIGSGVGRRLFEDMVATARSRGLRELRIGADPGAAGFYERLGAVRVGEVPSNSVPDRVLPSYQLKL